MGSCSGDSKDQETEKGVLQMLSALGEHKRKELEDPQGQSEAGLITKALDFSLNQVLTGTFNRRKSPVL